MRVALLNLVFMPAGLLAQATARDSAAASPPRPWTDAERTAACEHRPGARLRLYGCRPDANRGPAPLYVVDGCALSTDTSGAGRVARDTVLQRLQPGDIEDLQVLAPDSAVARYGAQARGGAVLIRVRQPSGPSGARALRPSCGG
jgi:hypothetical protein